MAHATIGQTMVPPLLSAVQVRPGSWDPVQRTVEVIWASENGSVRRLPFEDEPFVEVLGLMGSEVRLERLNRRGPVLDSHGEPKNNPHGVGVSLKDQIGVIERAWVADGLGLATLRFGIRPEIEWVRAEVAAGTFNGLSMRYRVFRYVTVGLDERGMVRRRATDWEPTEISLTPIPDDPTTQIRGADLWTPNPCQLLTQGTPPMDNPTTTGAWASPTAPPAAPTVAAVPPTPIPAAVPAALPVVATVAAVAPAAPVAAAVAPVAAVAPPAPVAAALAPPAPAISIPQVAAAPPVAVAPPPPAPAAAPQVAIAPLVAPAPAPAAAPVLVAAGPSQVRSLVEAQPVDVAAIALAERNRIAEIGRLASQLPEADREAFRSLHTESAATIETVRGATLDALVGAPGQADIHPSIQVTREGQSDQFRGIEEAILNRCDPATHEVTERARPYAGMTLLRVAEEVLLVNGQVPARGGRRILADQALSFRALMTGSDFPGLLANVANKILQDTYQLAARTFVPWSRRRTIPDFKTVSSLILHGGSQLEKVPEDAEIKRGTVAESKETWALSEYAKIWGLTRKAIINDDMQAFDDLPRRFALQAAQLESDVVYALLTANAVMADDGVALFDNATHGNLLTGTALDVTGMGAARALMMKQTDKDGNRLNVVGVHLMLPPELELKGGQLTQSIQATEAGKVNIWSGSFRSVQTESRLTDASQWYMMADPGLTPTIEYGFLAGENGPVVETRMGFDVLGTEIRVYHTFGAGVPDYRGMFRADET